MKLTQKELIKYYKYVFLKMNIKPIRQYTLNKINNKFITYIFNNIDFYNKPCFDDFDLLKTYKDLQYILKLYELANIKLNKGV